MNIIEVIPISKGINKDTLSYFTSKDLPLGAIVSIPVRNKNIKGIVVDSKSVSDSKALIKRAGFTLKKIEKVKAINFFRDEYIKALNDTALYFASSIGSTVDAIVPKYILENLDQFEIKKSTPSAKDDNKDDVYNAKIFAVSGEIEDRLVQWKSLIRQNFVDKKSLYFVLPTVEEATYFYETLKKGVEKYSFILHGNLSKKEMVNTWNEIIKTKHPVVVIGTYGFLSLNREDIKTVVVERESSRTYKLQRRPFPDIRYFVERYCEKIKAELYIADQNIRVETYFRKSISDIKEIALSKYNNRDLNIKIVDLKNKEIKNTVDTNNIDTTHVKDINNTTKQKESFKIISEETKDLVKRISEKGGHMFVLALRRGLSPITICEDCQNIVLCKKCNSPVMVHKNFFMCHRCGERRSAEEYCATCGSWKLKALGVGIDLVEEKLKEEFGDISIFKIDSDSVKTDKQAKDTVNKWINNESSILLGTEMALQYIHNKADCSAVVSIDSLFSLPDFRIEEKIISLLENVKSKTYSEMVIETRKVEERIFKYFIKNDLKSFYIDTLEERSMVGYPPFKTIIKFTIAGKKNLIIKEMEKVREELLPLQIDIFPAFTRNIKGEEVIHGILKIDQGKWPDLDLLTRLRNMSPVVSINIDPETLL